MAISVVHGIMGFLQGISKSVADGRASASSALLCDRYAWSKYYDQGLLVLHRPRWHSLEGHYPRDYNYDTTVRAGRQIHPLTNTTDVNTMLC